MAKRLGLTILLAVAAILLTANIAANAGKVPLDPVGNWHMVFHCAYWVEGSGYSEASGEGTIQIAHYNVETGSLWGTRSTYPAGGYYHPLTGNLAPATRAFSAIEREDTSSFTVFTGQADDKYPVIYGTYNHHTPGRIDTCVFDMFKDQ